MASDEEVEERPPDHVLEDDDEEGVAVVDLEHAHHVAVRRQPRQDPHLAQDVVQDVLCGWCAAGASIQLLLWFTISITVKVISLRKLASRHNELILAIGDKNWLRF